MGKNLNPADAERKAQKKKEKEKNKESRSKNREEKTAKTDTSELESEILKLEEASQEKSLDKKSSIRLAELREELARINKAKDDYVTAHPEKRNLIYRNRGPRNDGNNAAATAAAARLEETKALFGKNGLPKHPERSIYYDPIMNPYGVPPPGMPYIERPLLPHEIEQGKEIPDESSEEDDADAEDFGPHDPELDDIPLPLGLPPGKALPPPPLPRGAPPPPGFAPTMPWDPATSSFVSNPGASLHQAAGAFASTAMPPFPFAQTHAAQNGWVPPVPPGIPSGSTGFAQPMREAPPNAAPRTGPRPTHVVPQPSTLPPLPPGMPAPPNKPLALSKEEIQASATVFAEPELRDFKKESTAFVPNTLKRKKATEPEASKKPRVDAAAEVGGVDFQRDNKPDLMAAIRSGLKGPNP